MKNTYRHLATDFRIYAIIVFLLTGCGTEAPKKNHRAGNNDAFQQSSISSRVTASNHNLSLSRSSSYQNKNAINQQPSVAPFKSSAAVSSLSVSRTSEQNVPIGSPSLTLATSSLPTLPLSKSPLARISGVVKVTGKNGEILSPEGVIVNLEPTSAASELVRAQESRQYEVFMKDKTYTPKLMTIRQNDQVNFANNDKIKHNVFSTSVGNRFDLGTYGAGKDNKVALKTSGVVKVYCNIHPEMALFISVSPHNFSHITDKSGFFEINNLPTGEYRLTAWHIRGETQQIVNLQGLRTKKDILINTESYVPTPHKNKYDEAYKVKSVLFEDEFY